MNWLIRLSGLSLTLFAVSGLFAQQPAPRQNPPAAPAPTKPNEIAAMVNAQPIYEVALERALQSVPADERKAARPEFLDVLIEKAIVDQYLAALKIVVAPQEIDQKIEEFKVDLKKHEQDYATLMNKLKLTEPELREQIRNQLCWDKFVAQQATEPKLTALFNQAPEGFDGTTIRARHILIVPGNDAKAKQDTAAKLMEIKAQIQKTVADGLAKLPANADNVTREQRREALVEDAFSQAARANSSCPSKAEGGDLRWFPRFGVMAEPFAKAAFALKPYEVSDVITTPFGCHLILLVGRKPGTPVKYVDPNVKELVKAVYETKLKEAVLDQMKSRVKVEIMSPK
jgi:peptidyl-prolyl cis-trans isomerase C